MNNTVPEKLHRNDSFTEYYFNVDDTTGTEREKKYVGRKHDDKGFDSAKELNKEIKKDFEGVK